MTCYLIDLDGTLLVDAHAVDGAAEFICELNRRKAEYLLITNGSANAPKTIKNRLKAEGMEIEQRRILTSAEVAAMYLKEFLPKKSVCCIGSVWLEQCLKKEDIKLDEESAEIVLTGYDEHISMASLNHAIDLIMNGAIYISTNDDLWIPTGVAVRPHTGYIRQQGKNRLSSENRSSISGN